MDHVTSRPLRCYAKKEGDQWVAVCIDLSLAAQADSLERAKQKLESQISTYVSEARGVHQAYAEQLLSRKAPVAQRMTYLWLKARSVLQRLLKNQPPNRSTIFSEPCQPRSF